jgi:hypothetical protein
MMTDLFQSGQHPDADQLNAFIEQALSPQERDQTMAHLALCPDCRSVVALSLPPREESPLPQPRPARVPWFPGWRLAWPAAAFATALVLIVHFQHSASNEPRSSATNQAANVTPPAPGTPRVAATATQPASPKPLAATHAAAKIRRMEDLPLEGRQAGALPPDGTKPAQQPQQSAASPAGGVAMGNASGGMANNFTASSGAANGALGSGDEARSTLRSPAPAPAAAPMAYQAVKREPSSRSTTVDVSAASAEINVEAATTTATISEPPLLVLPNHRAMLSVASAQPLVVAIDTQHNVFFSDDSGNHWKKIRPPWSGSATLVGVSTDSPVAAAAVNGLAGGLVSGRAKLPGAESYASSEGNNVVTGIVKDPSGAMIPGATVSIKDRKTLAIHSVRTGGDGRFLLAGLPPGASEVQASYPGFQTFTSTLQVPASGNVQADLTLQIGNVSEAVTVEASHPGLAVRSKRKTSEPQPALFEITTDAGERWTSVDGHTWQRQ